MTEYPENLYGGQAPHNGTETSKAAAGNVTPRAGTIREQVLEMIQLSLTRGMTCDELEFVLGRPHTTVSARIRELSLMGLIDIAPYTRKTRYGRDARVYLCATSRVSCDLCQKLMRYYDEDDTENPDGWTVQYDVPGAESIVVCNECLNDDPAAHLDLEAYYDESTPK